MTRRAISIGPTSTTTRRPRAVPAQGAAPCADGHLDGRRLFEKISLEGFQSGLSWRTIRAKRVADAAQETVTGRLWQAWPLCAEQSSPRWSSCGSSSRTRPWPCSTR
ncbi:DNA-3-methyladenine glycosylase I [Streptomyces sp. G1]|uniref:DNA-3-methyladenine glycosylase I n=1 Tax=Streptomyces sp. G1 TaxID=361572 RepID=UPI0035AB9392